MESPRPWRRFERHIWSESPEYGVAPYGGVKGNWGRMRAISRPAGREGEAVPPYRLGPILGGLCWAEPAHVHVRNKQKTRMRLFSLPSTPSALAKYLIIFYALLNCRFVSPVCFISALPGEHGPGCSRRRPPRRLPGRNRLRQVRRGCGLGSGSERQPTAATSPNLRQRGATFRKTGARAKVSSRPALPIRQGGPPGSGVLFVRLAVVGIIDGLVASVLGLGQKVGRAGTVGVQPGLRSGHGTMGFRVLT